MNTKILQNTRGSTVGHESHVLTKLMAWVGHSPRMFPNADL